MFIELFDARSSASVGRDPVAVPEKIFGLTLILDFFDRCHSLVSLPPPQAAVDSLPICRALCLPRCQSGQRLCLRSSVLGGKDRPGHRLRRRRQGLLRTPGQRHQSPGRHDSDALHSECGRIGINRQTAPPEGLPRVALGLSKKLVTVMKIHK